MRWHLVRRPSPEAAGRRALFHDSGARGGASRGRSAVLSGTDNAFGGGRPSGTVDRVVLLDRQGRKRLVVLTDETLSIQGLGVLKAEKVRAALGGVLTIGGESFYVLRPSARDLAGTPRR